MHTFTLLTAIAWALLSNSTTAQYTFSGAVSTTPCLGEAEAYLISLRWLQIFQTDAKGAGTGVALVPSTLAANFSYYDEGATFGKPAPVYDSRAAVAASVSGTGYSGVLVTDVQYSVITSFTACDIVTLRWQSDSKSAKAKGVTVPVGTDVSYRGTDYLQVDLDTRLIYNATSSSDLLNYYIQLGDDIIKARI